MPFAPDEVEHKEFVPGVRGYRRSEVRSFLRTVAADVARLEDENAELRRHDRRAGSGRRSADAASAPNGEMLRILYELRGEVADLHMRVSELSGGHNHVAEAGQLSAASGSNQPELAEILRSVLDELRDLRTSVGRLEIESQPIR